MNYFNESDKLFISYSCNSYDMNSYMKMKYTEPISTNVSQEISTFFDIK